VSDRLDHDGPLVIGVTGNIACGKSLVMEELARSGVETIDADLVYRDLAQPGSPILADIVTRFGQAALLADGSLDRSALGAIVFKDPDALADLDRIVRPHIVREILRRVDASPAPVVAIDAIKLFESGLADRCDETWTVTCTARQQLERLMERNGFPREEALRRIEAQAPAAEKAARADRVIDNSGSRDRTRRQVAGLLSDARARQRETADTEVNVGMDSAETPIEFDVFFDYSCPCVWAASVWLREVEKHLGDRLEVRWRYFPLLWAEHEAEADGPAPRPDRAHQKSHDAMLTAVVVSMQGDPAFLAFHHALLDLVHRDGKDLGRKTTLAAALRAANLDMDIYEMDLRDRSLPLLIRTDHEEGFHDFGVFGTPTFVFPNGATAYLRMDRPPAAEDAMPFFEEFLRNVRDHDTVREIKRPVGPG